MYDSSLCEWNSLYSKGLNYAVGCVVVDYLNEFTINWAGMCAIAVVMIIPAVILTFIVQKHLVSGLTFGGVKG